MQNQLVIAYVRISDKVRQTEKTQLNSIHDYASKNGLTINKTIIEKVSGSKTAVNERQLNELAGSGHIVLCTDATRLGRKGVMDVIGLVSSLASNGGELHFTYTGQMVTETNKDNADTFFTVVGGSFAAAQEAIARSNRATAQHARNRKESGTLKIGRSVGAVVASKLDEHSQFIILEVKAGTAKTAILRKLEAKGMKVSRSQLYNWLAKNTL